MQKITNRNKEEKKQVYLTQKELADRWRLSETAVAEMRKKGNIPYFVPPGSSRIFYPIEEILRIEQERTVYENGEKILKYCKIKLVEKSVNPTSPKKEWRI